MDYRQYPAPPDLAPWVECAWTLRGPMDPAGQTILPDGRMELVFHLGAPPATGPVGQPQPGALIAGQMNSALHLLPNGPMDAIGIRLHPEAGMALPGEIHSMEDVLGGWARRTREELGSMAGDRARVDAAYAGLRTLLASRSQPDAAVAASVRRIESAYGCGAMDRFVPPGLQSRQWQRRFLAAAGLTPKAFARVVRLQHLVALYRSGPGRRWADLALECGFFDQAHLANDFRSFSGQSPEAFFREGRGMVEFYRDGFFQDPARRSR
jgi:hypothetical protein